MCFLSVSKYFYLSACNSKILCTFAELKYNIQILIYEKSIFCNSSCYRTVFVR